MFKKVLIANRGEIAVRIIKTCKLLGIHTVGVYSEADAEALHVKMVDEAYCIGGSRVVESYLNSDKIIEIALKSQVEAIHPGYGLLSENAEFARRCEELGIVFVGPSSAVIARMGSKIEARKAMNDAGIPVVPGTTYPLTNAEEAVRIADQFGYPVMLKASSGGGGIGMTIANNSDDICKSFAGNQKRAKDFFGDGAMYIEKYVKKSRHIEIQLLVDECGNAVYLWERECSIQRRHQKVIEEAPSLFLDERTRIKLGETAIKAAQAIGYKNAGTVEFLVDEHKQFYFLEMNTRLQVEHPVTEEITGLDLVAEQLRIAAGIPLNYIQADVKREGHAIEARIYAEDPKSFYPSPGTITKLELPNGKGIRHELGIHDKSIVTPFYDPMIAKLIVKGKDRNDAINVLQHALATYHIQGIKTNIPMLREIVSHPDFLAGDTTTDFLENVMRRNK